MILRTIYTAIDVSLAALFVDIIVLCLLELKALIFMFVSVSPVRQCE